MSEPVAVTLGAAFSDENTFEMYITTDPPRTPDPMVYEFALTVAPGAVFIDFNNTESTGWEDKHATGSAGMECVEVAGDPGIVYISFDQLVPWAVAPSLSEAVAFLRRHGETVDEENRRFTHGNIILPTKKMDYRNIQRYWDPIRVVAVTTV